MRTMSKVYQDNPMPDAAEDARLTASLADDEAELKRRFHACSDMIFRSFRIGGETKALLVAIDGLIEDQQLDEFLLKPLMAAGASAPRDDGQDLLSHLQTRCIAITQVKRAAAVTVLVREIAKGMVALLIDGQTEALVLSIPGGKTRAIEQTSSENTIRGPRDSFTESLRACSGDGCIQRN